MCVFISLTLLLVLLVACPAHGVVVWGFDGSRGGNAKVGWPESRGDAHFFRLLNRAA